MSNARLLCPVHGVYDCSPLLNGCSRTITPSPRILTTSTTEVQEWWAVRYADEGDSEPDHALQGDGAEAEMRQMLKYAADELAGGDESYSGAQLLKRKVTVTRVVEPWEPA